MIRIGKISLYRVNLRTRMPFRYGIAVLTELPHLFLEMEAEVDGVICQGIAADHLPPKWFTKDPLRDPKEEIDDMLTVIRHAATLGKGTEGESVFAIWRDLYERQALWGREQGWPPLLCQFGTSLVERALIDAFCRRHQKPFHRLLHENAFGINLGNMHEDLADSAPSDWLPSEPLTEVFCRHTVGLSDAIFEKEIPSDEKLTDGLPQSLEACVAHYGVRQLKIKITSNSEESIARLRKIFSLIESCKFVSSFSLDGNESFSDVGQFQQFWSTLNSDLKLNSALKNLLFVEQPFSRAIALSPEVKNDMLAWKERPPIIIDESDAEISSLRHALDVGYIGISHKNCKGVFRGIANACLLAKKRRDSNSPFLMSGEDLANIGPVALLQDLAVQAALGNKSVERNGHHYFAGLSSSSPSIQKQMLECHSDLYTASPHGWPTVRIENGMIQLASVNAAPFGSAFFPQEDSREQV
ncbi:MAG: hypothetical protein ABIP97_05790 [Chthoniobacterales bacterium]